MPKPVEIVLRGGEVALVDASDAGLLTPYIWRALRRGQTSYAVRGLSTNGRYQTILMHRVILGVAATDVHVDHRNGNGLDNRRCNLRLCSREENHRNSRRRCDNKSGFKGVSFDARINRYVAKIFIDKRVVYLGCFVDPAEAHEAYRRAATACFGEFARFE